MGKVVIHVNETTDVTYDEVDDVEVEEGVLCVYVKNKTEIVWPLTSFKCADIIGIEQDD